MYIQDVIAFYLSEGYNHIEGGVLHSVLSNGVDRVHVAGTIQRKESVITNVTNIPVLAMNVPVMSICQWMTEKRLVNVRTAGEFHSYVRIIGISMEDGSGNCWNVRLSNDKTVFIRTVQ